MIIKVKIIPNSRTGSVQRLGEKDYKVKLREKALEGHANAAMVDALAEYFKVKRTEIFIMHGVRSREKIIVIGAQSNRQNFIYL